MLLDAMDVRPGARLLSICSAGDNSLMLLLKDPALVVAADLNPVQLHLLELKKAAIGELSREETLQLLGFNACERRLQLLARITRSMDPAAVKYWHDHPDLVEAGVVHTGKFEKYFRLFARWVLPLIHARESVEQLLKPKTGAEQESYYQRKWNNRRWRLFFKVFFGKKMMGLLGRDPEFLRNVEVTVGDFIFSQAEKQLTSESAAHNFMLRYNLTGSFAHLLPDYLQPANYGKIRQNLSRLVIFLGGAEEAVKVHGRFDGMNISNIFEYMDGPLFRKVAAQLEQGLSRGGLFVYWNLMVRRRMADHLPSLVSEDVLAAALKERDRGFFYGNLVIEKKR